MSLHLSLHIGTQKSGTTFLQRALEALAPSLETKGVVYPVSGGGPKSSFTHEIATAGFLGHEEYPWVSQDAAKSRGSAWNRLLSTVRATDGNAIVSAEALSVIREPAAHKLVEAFAPDTVQVIVTGRDLGRVMPSSWQQHIRNGRSAELRGYLQYLSNLRNAEGDINERWETDRTQTFWRGFALGTLVKRWQRVVGADNVTLVVVPQRSAGPDELWLRFRQSLGLEQILPSTPPKMSDRKANVGITEPEAVVLAAVKMAGVDSGMSPADVRIFINRMVDEVFAARGDRGPSPKLPPGWFKRVRAWANEDIDILRDADPVLIGSLDELRVRPSAVGAARPALRDIQVSIAAAMTSLLPGGALAPAETLEVAESSPESSGQPHA